MPQVQLNKLNDTQKKVWKGVYDKAEKDYGAERASHIAWTYTLNNPVQTFEQPEVLRSCDTIKTSSSKLICRSEIGDVSKDYFVEGYIATTDPQQDGYQFTPELFNDIVRDLEESDVSLKGDIGHINARLEKGEKVDTSDIPTQSRLLKLADHKIDERGLWAKFKLDRTVDNFEKVWYRLQNGFYDSFSAEVRPKTGSTKIERSSNGQLIKKLYGGRLEGVTLTRKPVDRKAAVTAAYQQ